jgi:demethylmenaquinone methyltransferase / 2-methoxy-6-polyprenyl-1,4-benzoquinol methylase
MDRQPLWSEQDLAQPHEVADKARRVQGMFAAIAHRYDLINRLHSLGRDQAWRRAAARAAGVGGSDLAIDVACGTGDLTLALRQAGAGRVLGVDFTQRMLQFATCKTLRRGAGCIHYAAGDALRLPLASGSADALTIAFGIRNVTHPAAAICEFARVLRPGGRLVILEFGPPALGPLRAAYQFYFRQVLPRTASLIVRDRTRAYRYLPSSVNTFLSPQAIVDLLEGAGFGEITLRALTCGVAQLYRGVKGAGCEGR